MIKFEIYLIIACQINTCSTYYKVVNNAIKSSSKWYDLEILSENVCSYERRTHFF